MKRERHEMAKLKGKREERRGKSQRGKVGNVIASATKQSHYIQLQLDKLLHCVRNDGVFFGFERKLEIR